MTQRRGTVPGDRRGALVVAGLFVVACAGSPKTLKSASDEELDGACRVNNGPACNEMGVRLVRASRGDHGRILHAFPYFEHACSAGFGEACRELGKEYEQGEIVRHDVSKALGYFQLACAAHDTMGCFSLGYLYDQDERVPHDYVEAARLYALACSVDAKLCSALGNLYSVGHGVPLDGAKAFELEQRACEHHDDAGCMNLAGLYYRGKFVPRDFEKAKAAARAGCTLDSGVACLDVALIEAVERAGSVDTPEETLRTACERDEARSSESCFDVAVKSLLVKNTTAQFLRVVGTFERLCNAHIAGACHLSGVIAQRGIVRARDERTAKWFFGRACAGGLTESCALAK